jgi:hypothetical protein
MGDARLLDPAALDKKRSPRGRLSIVVPTEWLREGARLEVDLPARVRCDLCDGGGCDACERSGAYRTPEERKPLAITLPRVSDDHFALRLTNPFGATEPTLLVVRVAGGLEPSAGVRFVAPNHDVEPSAGAPQMPSIPQVPAWMIWAIIALVAAVAGYLTRGR